MKRKQNFELVLKQELDEIPSYCSECGQIHGCEACQYDEEEPWFQGDDLSDALPEGWDTEDKFWYDR